MSYKRTSQEAQAIAENVITLNVKELVYLMPPFEHQHFMKRAAAGHDVYAYRIETAPSGATITFNIWDTDTRIPFSDQPMTWTITDTQSLGEHNYLVCLHNERENTDLEIIHYVVSGHGTPDSDQVRRRILAYVQHCNVFGGWPQSGLVS